MRTSVCTVVVLCAFLGRGAADEIIFMNGERLIGTLKHAKEHKLTFVSEMAGEITVDLSGVQRIATDAPMAIRLTDGAVLKGNTLESDGERFTVSEAPRGKAEHFATVPSGKSMTGFHLYPTWRIIPARLIFPYII